MMAAVELFLHPVVIFRDSQTAELGGTVWGIQVSPLIDGEVQGGEGACPGLNCLSPCWMEPVPRLSGQHCFSYNKKCA